MNELKLLDTVAASRQMHTGQVIAYPTEAVYGLGCDPANETAVRNILKIKGREASAGFVLLASDFTQLQAWIGHCPQNQLDIASQSWPGPITWLFPRAESVPDYVAGTHKTIAVRITAHEPSRLLCEAFGSAIISSSANPTAAQPARTIVQLNEYFPDQLGGILEGPLGDATRPSEIRDLATGAIIRPG